MTHPTKLQKFKIYKSQHQIYKSKSDTWK